MERGHSRKGRRGTALAKAGAKEEPELTTGRILAILIGVGIVFFAIWQGIEASLGYHPTMQSLTWLHLGRGISAVVVMSALTAILLLQQRRRLEKDLRTRSEEAERVRRRFEEIMMNNDGEMIRRAAASMAHEIRNALAGIAGTMEVLDSGRQWSDLPLEVTGEFRLQVTRIQDSVDELLAWSNPSELRRTVVDLHALIDGALRQACGPGTPWMPSIVRDFTAGRLMAHVDAARLSQALKNIIRNATQAMPRGGRLTVTTAREDGRNTIRLRDSGGGMSPHVQARAFEPFFTTRATGTGLGLPVVRRIIEAHGGDVTIEASDTAGTTVLLTLPSEEDDLHTAPGVIGYRL